MKLRDKQIRFAWAVSKLIQKSFDIGYEPVMGEVVNFAPMSSVHLEIAQNEMLGKYPAQWMAVLFDTVGWYSDDPEGEPPVDIQSYLSGVKETQ